MTLALKCCFLIFSIASFEFEVNAEGCGTQSKAMNMSSIAQKVQKVFSGKLNFYDGPATISQAPSSTTNKALTLEQMKYYNYWAAATDCPGQTTNLTCCTCGFFRKDVTKHWIFENSVCDTFAMVGLLKNRKEIVLAFRGSRGPQNWLLDFTFTQTNCPNSNKDVKMHKGFVIATNCLYEKIMKLLIRLIKNNPGFKLTCCGHSLGGAMATLTIYFLKTNNQFPKTKMQLVPIAQPRVGNPAFAKYMNNLGIPCSRVTANNDIVPHIPSVDSHGTALITNYVHHHPEVWINGDDVMFCKTDKAEDPNCSNSRGPLYNPQDHLSYFDVHYGTMCFNSSDNFVKSTILSIPDTLTTMSATIPKATCPGKIEDGQSSSKKGQKKGKPQQASKHGKKNSKKKQSGKRRRVRNKLIEVLQETINCLTMKIGSSGSVQETSQNFLLSISH